MKHNEIAAMEGTLVCFTQEHKKEQGGGVTISKDTAEEFSKMGVGWGGGRRNQGNVIVIKAKHENLDTH